MNNVQKIEHKSRSYIPKIIFQSESETSWIFNSDGDGEIYDAITNNILSYTINGNVVHLPIVLENGKSYSISITKIDHSESADITFLTRRAMEKKVVINVPNYSVMPTDAHLYILLSQIVKVYNCNSLTPSNYLGAGSWSTTPLVRTINLPTSYNTQNITWYTINYDDGDMICWGSTYTGARVNNQHVVCRIKPNGDVYDYYENSLNEVSHFYTSSWVIYHVQAVTTDFVGGNYIIHFNCYGGQSASLQKASKSNLTLTNSGIMISGGYYHLSYNPHKRRFVYYGDMDIENMAYVNFLVANNITNKGAYSRQLASPIKCNVNTYTNFVIYDESGKYSAIYASKIGDGAGGNGQPGNPIVNQTNNIAMSVSRSQSSFALNDFVGTLTTCHKITAFSEANLGDRHLSTDERSKMFFFTTTSPHEDKVLVIDTNELTPEIGYIQESETIQCISNNNYV